MNSENKIMKFIGIGILICLIGIFICMVTILCKLNSNKQLTTIDKVPVITNETAPTQVISLPENRIAVIDTNKNSEGYGRVKIFEYDKEKKGFIQISQVN